MGAARGLYGVGRIRKRESEREFDFGDDGNGGSSFVFYNASVSGRDKGGRGEFSS